MLMVIPNVLVPRSVKMPLPITAGDQNIKHKINCRSSQSKITVCVPKLNQMSGAGECIPSDKGQAYFQNKLFRLPCPVTLRHCLNNIFKRWPTYQRHLVFFFASCHNSIYNKSLGSLETTLSVAVRYIEL